MSAASDTQSMTSAQSIVRKRRANRAKRACLSCRSRKVRCDVTRQSPSSCSNCIWNSTECVVIEPRKSPTRKKRTAPLKQEKEVKQDNWHTNEAKETTPDTSSSDQCRTSGEIQDPDFTVLKHLRDSIKDTPPPANQFTQNELPSDAYMSPNTAEDAMEWSFLEKASVGTNTAASFVDSGFHDESCDESNKTPSAKFNAPAASPTDTISKHKWPDTYVWPAKTAVNDPGDDLLDNFFALSFDFLRHI
ncbi:unnamed protein product [Fusarium equiseti]|uniref:Zn(2)-C6 fungal-type domain-containing protein n=1 Tax=Fusarium equiseti TaxID=61235 RepID=A0A8J2J0N6_FUSEQ|nr:unnamed protein product [Fusarium equiseti]